MKLQAAIFDWAGTMVDFGSRAPMLALREVFASEGVEAEEAEIRRHMGMAKREHVTAILSEADVGARWRRAKGADWNEADVDRIMEALEPAMRAAAAKCVDLVPGAAEVAESLRARGLRIGSTTGYTRTMMTEILRGAERQGYAPEMVVCAGDTAQGRPAPLMIWKCLVEFGVWPAAAAVVIDDAPVGLAAGRHAGCWTVGLAGSGNGVGLSQAEFTALSRPERLRRMRAVADEFLAAGADFVIETVADLPELVVEIDRRLADGDLPGERGEPRLG